MRKTQRITRRWRNVLPLQSLNGGGGQATLATNGGGGLTYIPTYAAPVTTPVSYPAYQAPVVDTFQAAYEAAIANLSPMFSPEPVSDQPYNQPSPIVWEPIETGYVQPTPVYETQSHPPLLEPVSQPIVTYMDPAINGAQAEESSGIIESIINFFSPEPVVETPAYEQLSSSPAVTYTDPAMASAQNGQAAVSGGGTAGTGTTAAATKKATTAQAATKSSSAIFLILILGGIGALTLISKKS